MFNVDREYYEVGNIALKIFYESHEQKQVFCETKGQEICQFSTLRVAKYKTPYTTATSFCL